MAQWAYKVAYIDYHGRISSEGLETLRNENERRGCKFQLLRYVPDPVRNEFVHIGVILREADAGGASAHSEVRFTRDWRRVRCLDPNADTALLEARPDAYVEALRTTLPGLPAEDLYWRVTMMIGAYLYAFSDTHRLDVLAKDVCDPWDANETLEQLTSFIVGGLEAQASAQPAHETKAASADEAKTTRAARAA